ncbi:glycoside hydrolase [Daedaleopsis nitida]|nr:glycoside hydrolase [Daedaleopsis nitida]
MHVVLFSILAVVPVVSGHGFLSSVTIDGKTYKGNTPGSSSISSPIRMVSDIGPVKGATNPDITCGLSAQKAAIVADAQPGSTVSLMWRNPTRGNWIHDVGPLMTYLASCGSAGCASFNHSSARWFKIQESGLRSDGTWAMHDLYVGEPAKVALPSNLAAGEYLLRHELLALHAAQTLGGAEFYPACVQLRVGGTKSGKPAATVALPGAYSDTDKGILVDVYTDPGASYEFPGPAVSNLAGKTVALVASNATVTNSTEAEVADATTSTSNSTSTSVSAAFATETMGRGEYEFLIFPRGVSRIMPSLQFA